MVRSWSGQGRLDKCIVNPFSKQVRENIAASSDEELQCVVKHDQINDWRLA